MSKLALVWPFLQPLVVSRCRDKAERLLTKLARSEVVCVKVKHGCVCVCVHQEEKSGLQLKARAIKLDSFQLQPAHIKVLTQ